MQMEEGIHIHWNSVEVVVCLDKISNLRREGGRLLGWGNQGNDEGEVGLEEMRDNERGIVVVSIGW